MAEVNTLREPAGIAEGEAKKVAGAVKTRLPPEASGARYVAAAAIGTSEERSRVPVTTASEGLPTSSVATAPGGTTTEVSAPPGGVAFPSTGCATRNETLTFAAAVPGLKICNVGVTPPPEV